jgi:hypothetical protein
MWYVKTCQRETAHFPHNRFFQQRYKCALRLWYAQGQKIWVRDPEIVWRSAEITASNDKVVEALDDNGQVV